MAVATEKRPGQKVENGVATRGINPRSPFFVCPCTIIMKERDPTGVSGIEKLPTHLRACSNSHDDGNDHDESVREYFPADRHIDRSPPDNFIFKKQKAKSKDPH